MFWKKVETIIHKRQLFPLIFTKSNINRFQKTKEKFILHNILSNNLTINLLINFVINYFYLFFVLSVFLLYLSIYVYVMCERSK